jgi:hypothetical protein
MSREDKGSAGNAGERQTFPYCSLVFRQSFKPANLHPLKGRTRRLKDFNLAARVASQRRMNRGWVGPVLCVGLAHFTRAWPRR